MKVKVVNFNTNELPTYATIGSAAVDARANLTSPLLIRKGTSTLIPTGLHVEIPIGYEIQVRPRSGLALKYGITVLNTPGTIDSDYRGDVGVILINHSNDDFVISPGDRIAQLVLSRVEQIEWELVNNLNDLSSTDRDQGGFNSTGTK